MSKKPMHFEYASFEEFFKDIRPGRVYEIEQDNDVYWYEDTEEKKMACVHGPFWGAPKPEEPEPKESKPEVPPLPTPKPVIRKRIRPTWLGPLPEEPEVIAIEPPKKKRITIDLTGGDEVELTLTLTE